MKYLIITVAGTATRFNRDTKEDTLKCLYYEDSSEYALLHDGCECGSMPDSASS